VKTETKRKKERFVVEVGRVWTSFCLCKLKIAKILLSPFASNTTLNNYGRLWEFELRRIFFIKIKVVALVKGSLSIVS